MFKMKQLSFKAKLILLCVFMSTTSLLIGGTGIYGLNRIVSSYEQVTDGVMPNLILLNDMYLSYRFIRINFRTLGLPELPADQEKSALNNIQKSLEEYDSYAKKYNDIPFVEGEKELYAEVEKNWDSFKNVLEKGLNLYKANDETSRQALMNIYFTDSPKVAKLLKDAMDKIHEFHVNNGQKFVTTAKEQATQFKSIVFLTAIIGILVGLSFGIIFASVTAKAIINVTSNLSQTAKQVNQASIQIAESSQELSQATTEQAASLQETAASLEEISTMIQKASESANSTASSSADSHTKAEEGKDAVSKMISVMQEIRDSNLSIMNQVNESNEQMGQIVDVIKNIGDKTKVINEIVFQTKLLSFNASVEAARAGEHGKGFAVVAQEVGNLAEMSGKAAKEITDMLDSSISKVDTIVNNTKARVQGLIEEGKLKVEGGTEVANQCAVILEEIVKNVANVSDLANEISQASKEQAQGVSEINKAMGQLDVVTQNNATNSEATADFANKLTSHAGALNNAVSELIQTVEGGKLDQVKLHSPNSTKNTFSLNTQDAA